MSKNSKYSSRVITIPGSQRPDGTVRKDVVVKEDYHSQEMIPKYVHPNGKKKTDQSENEGARSSGTLPKLNIFLDHFVPPKNEIQQRKKVEVGDKLDCSISITTKKPNNEQQQTLKEEIMISSFEKLQVKEKEDKKKESTPLPNTQPQREDNKETTRTQSLIEKRDAEMKVLKDLVNAGVLEEEEIIQKWNDFVNRWSWSASSL